MMAPHFERARMLHVAIEQASHELVEPIDRIEVGARNVVVSAGKKRLTLRYSYANSYSPDGAAIPGGGNWVVESTGLVEAILPSFVEKLRTFLRI